MNAHLLHHFWIAMAFVRHPLAAMTALALLAVVGLFLKGRKR